MQHDIRLAPAFVARICGFAFAAVAAAFVVLVVIVSLTDLPGAVPVVVVAVGLFAVGVVGLALLKATYVVRFTDLGYRVRFVRGAGVTRARWLDVEDAVTTYVAGTPCIVLRLKDGGSTTVPVDVLAIDREALVHLVQERLERGRGLKRLR